MIKLVCIYKSFRDKEEARLRETQGWGEAVRKSAGPGGSRLASRLCPGRGVLNRSPSFPGTQPSLPSPGDGEGLTQVKDSVCLTQNIKGHHAALSKGHRLLEAP